MGLHLRDQINKIVFKIIKYDTFFWKKIFYDFQILSHTL